MQAAPAVTLVPLPYPAGMQATTTPQQQQQQQVYPPPGQQQHHQVLQPQQLPLPPHLHQVPAPAQMPAAAPLPPPQQQQQDGYGAAAAGGGLHSMPPVNNHRFNHSAPSLSGQKRDSSGAPVHGGHGGHDSADGAFVKLFVGSVPRTITEEEVRPMFAEHGNVLEVAIIKDKRTGNQQGCCFIKYSTVEEAERAIRALHNQKTLPGGVAPVQVRYADGERERLGAVEHKLFVGSLNKQASEKEIEEIFLPFGRVDDVYIMRDEQKQSRGCAFIKYSQRDQAQAAINALNGVHTMNGCDQPLAVRFADPKRPKGGDARVGGPGVGGPGFSPRQGSQGQQGPGGPRPMHAQMGHPAGRGPPMGWRPQGGLGLGHPQVGPSPYGASAGPRGGPVTGVPQMGGMIVSPVINGHLQGPMPASGQVAAPVILAPSQQQTSQGYYQQASQQRTQQYVLQPPQQPQQQQQQQQQIQQMQQPPYVQMPPQQQPQAYLQQQVPSRPMMQVQPGQQQQSQQPQVLMQLHSQAAQQQRQLPEQVAPQPMGQLQALQPGQQQPQQQSQPGQQSQLQQVYYQVPLTATPQQLQQPAYYLPVQQPQPLVPVPAPQPPAPPLTCDWSEHTSPEGYKYYYNSTSGESKWEKPEELKTFEQQQQQQQSQISLAATANPAQQQFSNSPAVQQTLSGMSYMQPQPVSNGSVEQPRQQGPPGANLFVFRIPDDFTDESMKETFAPFGNVISARVGVERESGRNRGFGFVSFDSAASAEAAIQGLNNVAVGGRRLKVERKRGEENGTQVYQQQQY